MVSFALESSDNRTLREAIDAVARTVDEAIVQPTDNGLEIRAVDAANVFSVEAIIPLGAFDRSSALAGDAFGVDVDKLSSTLGNINKTSGVFLEDTVDNAFTVTDRSTGDTTEFEIKDPESMRDPPDLAGSVKMMEYGTSVSVPDSQFRRVVRVAGEVGEKPKTAVGVAPRDGSNGPMALKTVTKGDTDEVVGYPDAEFESATGPQETAGALYEHKYLDSASLGFPDRAVDVSVSFDGVDTPLRIGFEVGETPTASIQYHISPRIGGGATDSFQELESADITSPPVTSPNFIAAAEGSKSDTFVEAIASVVDERRVMFTRAGVESRAIEEGNALLSVVQAEPGFFDTYREVDGFPMEPVGLVIDRLTDYYDLWLKNQSLTVTFDSDTRFMGLTHPHFSVKMATIDPDAVRREPTIPDQLDLSAEAEVGQSELARAIRSLSAEGSDDTTKEVGVIATSDSGTNSGVYLTDETGKRVSVGKRMQGNALGIYSGDYIRAVGQTLIESSPLPATLRLGNDFPLAVAASNSNGTLTHTTITAPRQKESKQDALDSAPIADGMDGSGVDLSFYTDDTGSADVGLFENISEESAAERARKDRFQSYPVTVEVSTGYSADSIRIENADDLAVDEDTLDAVQDDAEAFVDGTNVGSRETVGEVTFTSDTEYEIDYTDAQPSTERRITTDDGVRFRETGSSENDYVYYSERSETPARFQMVLRAVEDDNTFGVKLGHKVPTEAEVRDEEWVIDGLDDILDAYAELVAFIEETSIREIVEASGVDVELSVSESENEIEALAGQYVDYSTEVKPRQYNDTFYASLDARKPIAPDATYRANVTAKQPESASGDYEVHYSLSYTVDGPTYGAGQTINSPEIASRTVGTSNTRAGVTQLMEAALEEIREFGDFFARTDRSEDLPTAGIPSPRQDNAASVRQYTRAFLPAGVTRESLKNDAQQSRLDIPTEFTNVPGIGPARAEAFTEKGISDVVDLMALISSSTGVVFWASEPIRELPDDPKQAVREAAGDLWGEFVWPKRQLPGDLDKDLPDEQIVVGGDTATAGQPLPDGVDAGRWDVVVFARPDNDYNDRFEAAVLESGVRRNPDLELPDESLEAAEDKTEHDPNAFEDGDVVAVASFSEDARGPPRVAAVSHEPGIDLLEERTTDADGNLTVTADDGWTAIAPLSLRDADEGDLQRGYTLAPLQQPDAEGLGLGVTVGWDTPGARQYAYVELSDVPYFVYGLDPDDMALSGLGSSDDPAQAYSVWLYRAPAGDEIIGWDPETEAGATPAEPVFRSEYESEYDMFPFFRSKESVTDLIGETVLGRGTDGQIRETEIVDEVRDAAGVIAADITFPDGRYFIPASSEFENSTFEIIGTPIDGPDEGAGEEVRDVSVSISEKVGGFSEGSPRISLDPEIGDDPNNIAGAIRGDVSDTFPREGLRRFYIGQRNQIATAKVRGGGLVEEAVGSSSMTVEKLSEPLELVAVEYNVDTPEGDTNPTGEEIREAFPTLSTPQAESVAELVWDVDGVLQFTPSGLTSIKGIGDRTVGDMIGGEAGYKTTVPIGEQGAERADEEPAEEETPDDDFGRTIEGTFSDEVIEEAEVEEEVVDDTDDVETVMEEFDVTRDIAQEVVDALGDSLPSQLPTALDILRRVGAAGETIPVPSLDMMEADMLRDGIRRTSEGDDEPDETGPTDAEIDETIQSINAVLAETEDILDRARDAEVMGRAAIGRLNQTVTRLETLLREVRAEPTAEDVSDAEAAISELQDRQETAREVIEEAEAEAGDDQPTDGEMETIIEGATQGVEVTVVASGPESVPIRVLLEAVDEFIVDVGQINVTPGPDDTRVGMLLRAVERWEEFAQLDNVDTAAVNEARAALNGQFGDRLGFELEMLPEPEPEPEPGAGQEPPEDETIPERLERQFAEELGGMGLPSRPRPPAEFAVDEDMGRISARPEVPPEWDGVLEEELGVVTGSIDDPDQFFADYLSRLLDAIDFSQVNIRAINQRRTRLNDRYGINLPLLDANGEPVDDREEAATGEPGEEPTDRRIEPLRVQSGRYTVPDDVPADTAEAAREQAESALGPAEQFDDNTRVGEAIIQDGQVAVRVAEGERILDARRKQEDLEQRTPDFDMNAPLTANTVTEAFPRMLGNGQAFAEEFSTLEEMVNAPLSRLESIFGVGESTIKRLIDNPAADMDRSIMEQRNRPLGIEEDVPDPSPMPEIREDEDVEQESDVPEGVTGGVPEVAVSIPPTAPAGERWLAQQIQRGNRVQPNKYDENPIVEIVFPERISGQVRNVVAQYDISRGAQTVSVQNPSFRDELPQEAASLKSIQFLLSGGSFEPATDLRSSGYDIQQIINDLSDRLIVVTRSPVVRASITFPN